MERLCDIDRGIVYTHRLAVSDIALAVALTLAKDFSKDFLYQSLTVYSEIKITVYRLDLCYNLVTNEALAKLVSYHHGGFTHGFSKLKARKGKITHILFWRNGNSRGYLFGRNAKTAQFFCNVTFIIHNSPLRPKLSLRDNLYLN